MLNDLLYGLKYLYAKTSKGHVATDEEIDEFVFDLLDQSRGLAFGEIHGAYAFPRFLKARMKKFADSGVKALFVEMVPRHRQHLLDAWQNTADPKPLIDYFNARRKANSSYQWANYWAMMKAAHEVGIRVYGIDTHPEDDRNGRNMSVANSVWMGAIKRVIGHFGPDDKYLVFGGQGHFRYTNGGARGVSYELGIPAIQLDYGQPLLVENAVGCREHLIRIPLGDDHISFFKGPMVKHREISYTE